MEFRKHEALRVLLLAREEQVTNASLPEDAGKPPPKPCPGSRAGPLRFRRDQRGFVDQGT